MKATGEREREKRADTVYGDHVAEKMHEYSERTHAKAQDSERIRSVGAEFFQIESGVRAGDDRRSSKGLNQRLDAVATESPPDTRHDRADHDHREHGVTHAPVRKPRDALVAVREWLDSNTPIPQSSASAG